MSVSHSVAIVQKTKLGLLERWTTLLAPPYWVLDKNVVPREMNVLTLIALGCACEHPLYGTPPQGGETKFRVRGQSIAHNAHWQTQWQRRESQPSIGLNAERAIERSIDHSHWPRSGRRQQLECSLPLESAERLRRQTKRVAIVWPNANQTHKSRVAQLATTPKGNKPLNWNGSTFRAGSPHRSSVLLCRDNITQWIIVSYEVNLLL